MTIGDRWDKQAEAVAFARKAIYEAIARARRNPEPTVRGKPEEVSNDSGKEFTIR